MKSFISFIFQTIFLVGIFGQSPELVDVSKEIGITHGYLNNFEVGSGVVIFDINNDHFEDLYFTGGKLGEGLYLNNKDGSYTNISDQSGIILPDFPSQAISNGAVSGDIDNDGWRDLIITTISGSHCFLFRNLVPSALSFDAN